MAGLLRAVACCLVALWAAPAAASCASLTGAVIGDATITRATQVGDGRAGDQVRLPAFCRVEAIARPVAGSAIGIEVWLPDQWNGRYQQVGNGGWAGTIPMGGLAAALRHGYLTAGTDNGHHGDSTDASWARGHPERLVDYGTRSLHETRALAHAVAQLLYGRAPARSYFSGCSDGGREALITAQRFPDDFDGWLVGAPANDWSRLSAALIGYGQAVARGPLGQAELTLLARAALARCGRPDGVVTDPARCRFTPASLACRPRQHGDCLDAAQIAAATQIYWGGSRAGRATAPLPGLYGSMGTEATPGQWLAWFGGAPGFGTGIAGGHFRDVVYGDPALDPTRLDPLRALADGKARTDATLAAIDPDLHRVRDGDKKIIQYHGWADPAISPEFSLRYMTAVRARMGGDVAGFYRLFLVPGMAHCAFGPGANTVLDAGLDPAGPRHDAMDDLVAWVEQGVAPASLTAIGRRHDDPAQPIDRVAVICPWPQTSPGGPCRAVRRPTR